MEEPFVGLLMKTQTKVPSPNNAYGYNFDEVNADDNDADEENETANKYAVWKENWVEFCNMAGKIRWIYKNFPENYITGKIVAG